MNIIEFLAERQEYMASDVFGRWIDTLETFQLVQKAVIQLVEDFLCGLLEELKINQYAVMGQVLTGHADLNLPVVPVKLLALAVKLPQLVSCGHLRDDLQFIHRSSPPLSVPCCCCRVRFTTFGAFPLHDDTGAGSVRTKNAIFEIGSLFALGRGLPFISQPGAAFHAEPALRGNEEPAA
jgi:hypothetical protein